MTAPASGNRRLVAAGAVLGLLLPAAAQQSPTNAPLGPRWKAPLRDVIALAVSPEGGRVVAADLEGWISAYDPAGSLAWRVRVRGADSLVAGPTRTYTLAYTARSPLRKHVSFINDAGKVVLGLDSPGPIEDVALSPDGRLACVATGDRLLFCSVRSRHPVRRQLAVSGAVRRLQPGPGDSFYVVFQDRGDVELVKSSGRIVWRSGTTGDFCSIATNEGGKRLAMAVHTPDDKLHISLLDANHQAVVAQQRDGRMPAVRLTADGNAVLMTYEHKGGQEGRVRFGRRLYYLSSDRREWTKGGEFQVPLFVSAAPNGLWLVALDTRRGVGRGHFRLFNGDGDKLFLYTPSANILICTASQDGAVIATYRVDGMLECLGVNVTE